MATVSVFQYSQVRNLVNNMMRMEGLRMNLMKFEHLLNSKEIFISYLKYTLSSWKWKRRRIVIDYGCPKTY